MTKLSDVAKYVGVSPGTVSLAINGSPLVKEATRARVLEAVRTLGYVPNASARSLATSRRLVIGVVRCVDDASQGAFGFSDTVDTYLSDMLRAIERESVAQGYSLMVDWSGAGTVLPPLCAAGRTDGVLIVGGMLPPGLPERLRDNGLPAVLVGSRSELLDWADSDYAQAMQLAVDALYERGHRDIALLLGPDNSQSTPYKLEGYHAGLRAHGIEPNPDFVAQGSYSGEGGYQALSQILERGMKPTAFVAAADCMAVGALRLMAERGMRCPENISAVGYEDGLLAEYALPPLHSVSAQKQEIGRAACRLLMRRIAQKDAPLEHTLIEPKLIERASVRTL